MKAEVKELVAAGLSRDEAERIAAKGNQARDQQLARDERRAAEAATAKGLTGKQAERFRARYVEQIQAGRKAVRDHVAAVLNSPAAAGRPEAARDVAIPPGLSTREAIERLERMPIEAGSADVNSTAQAILRA